MSSIIKVAQIRWGEPIGGVERVLRDLAYFVDRNAFQMKFIFLRSGGAYEAEMRASGHEVVVIPARNGYDISMRIALIKELRNFSPDIINEHSIPPLLRPIIKIAVKAPLITFEHGEIEVNKRKGKPWLNLIHGFEMKYFSNFIITNSGLNKALIAKTHHIPQKRIKVIYLGIDLDKFTLKQDKPVNNDLVIGYIGRIHNFDKGTDYLPLVASELLKNGITNFQLNIIGDGPDRAAVNQSAEKLGVNSHFDFLGRRPDINGLLAGMDILIVPSKTEAFGLVAIEALAAGTRVVAFATGALPEILGECSEVKLVPFGDVAGMAKAILALWKMFGKKRSVLGRKYVVERYDTKRMVSEIEDVYRINTMGRTSGVSVGSN